MNIPAFATEGDLLRNPDVLDWLEAKAACYAISDITSDELVQAIRARRSYLPLTCGAYD